MESNVSQIITVYKTALVQEITNTKYNLRTSDLGILRQLWVVKTKTYLITTTFQEQSL